MKKNIFIGLYSKSEIVAAPWAESGIECHLFDLKSEDRTEGNFIFHGGDIREKTKVLAELVRNNNVVFIAAFPPCTDMAISGAAHFEKKALNDSLFWARSMELVFIARDFAEISGAPYFIENPMSMISTLWRKPDYKFSPNEYGGYLPEGHQHKLFPEIFPPRDAYKKETWLWTGGGVLYAA
jgi:hypothetical protein